MPSIILDLAVPAERLLALYEGRAKRIMAHSRDGRSVSVAARHFRPFISHVGLYGAFELTFSAEGELLALRRLDH